MQVNVRPESMQFYADLLAFLGWNVIYDGPVPPENVRMLGVGDSAGSSVWFIGQVNGAANDYDGPGMNHLGIGVESQTDVDAAVAYLKEHSVPALFDTPRHRPEFSEEGRTYYQVMFETPDHLLLEVVYTGPKQD
jgi:catechol 2,3-dioxygenase-like lactoylglutathione lyase family enzyme